MKKILLLAALSCMSLMGAHAESVVPLAFGNFDQWITRHIKESSVLGGQEKKVFEIGPAQKIVGAKAYTNLGGSPWATSNVYAKGAEGYVKRIRHARKVLVAIKGVAVVALSNIHPQYLQKI